MYLSSARVHGCRCCSVRGWVSGSCFTVLLSRLHISSHLRPQILKQRKQCLNPSGQPSFTGAHTPGVCMVQLHWLLPISSSEKGSQDFCPKLYVRFWVTELTDLSVLSSMY